MIQPWQLLRGAAVLQTRCDLVGDVVEAAGHENLVRRAEIGAPVDFHVVIGETPIGVLAVEQHDDAVDTGRPALGEATPAGRLDLDRLRQRCSA